MANELYYSEDDGYRPFPTTVFAHWRNPLGDNPPNPCRKYHISADPGSAAAVASLVLPILREMRLWHKVVQSPADLSQLQRGDQAGKFITVYAPLHASEGELIKRVGGALAAHPGLRPSPKIPLSRQYKNNKYFHERPVDERMFIYGGYEADPKD
jgi:hypothetical protein